MAQMAFTAAMVMLLSAGLIAGQDPCLNVGTKLVSDCAAFTSTLQSDKGFATADDATLKTQTDQETQKNGLPSTACCNTIQSFSNGTTHCACDATIVAYAEAQYGLGSTAATQQALLTTTRVGAYACTTKVTNGKPMAGTGTLPSATGCSGSPPSTPPPTKTAG